MFKRKPTKHPRIDTLIGARTRINGDVEFSGGLHLDGYINGNVSSEAQAPANLSVSEQGGIEGSVAVRNIRLNGIVKGDIDASERVELGAKARVLGSVRYSVIETAVGAQINGKLIHRSKRTAEGQPGAAQAGAGKPDDGEPAAAQAADGQAGAARAGAAQTGAGQPADGQAGPMDGAAL